MKPYVQPQSSALDPVAILFALAQAVEQRDPHTARHCERLALISVALGMALELDRASLLALCQGGYLHDIGKVGIPDSILFKPGRLTAKEWTVMRSHPVRGQEICQHLRSLTPVLPIIRHHHERWDGTGYPDGLRGEQIPLLARLLQIADIYDALTSPRPYKRAYDVKHALQIIEEETERGWRDPEVVTLFFQLHKGVISQIDLCSEDPRRFGDLHSALQNLGSVLHGSASPDLEISVRTFSPLLRSEPANGSGQGAKGTWHTG
jgi:HD-GYP domain-containing protein (c-di-GMP phosphodiesterase class II)